MAYTVQTHMSAGLYNIPSFWSVKKKHNFSFFSYHFAFYQKKKKTLTLSTSQTRFIVSNNFCHKQNETQPSPPPEQIPLYTVYFTYLQFSLFAFYIIIKVVSTALKYIQCSFLCNYNHYPDCTYSIISHRQSLMSYFCASF